MMVHNILLQFWMNLSNYNIFIRLIRDKRHVHFLVLVLMLVGIWNLKWIFSLSAEVWGVDSTSEHPWESSDAIKSFYVLLAFTGYLHVENTRYTEPYRREIGRCPWTPWHKRGLSEQSTKHTGMNINNKWMGPHVTKKSHKGHNDMNKSAAYQIGKDFYQFYIQ